jgi:anion-transporting  ArsA/GET3 family ATPase
MSSEPEPFFAERRRIWVCVGAGGVGKTTVAAALAIALARDGRRVLCLTVDPARRLAESLGLSTFSADAHTIEPAELARAGFVVSGSLDVMMLNAKRVFDEIVTRHASSAQARKGILDNEFYEYVSAQLAGTHAYMAMEKLLSVRDDPSYDAIVLDTPPMAQALDFLSAPDRLLQTIDNPFVRALSRGLLRGGRLGVGLAARGVSVVFRALGGITGATFLERASEFVLGMNDLFEGFRARADRVAKVFRSDEVGYVLVTAPVTSALTQAAAFSNRLESYGLRARGLVVNRVYPRATRPAAGDAEVATALRERGLDDAPTWTDPIVRAAREQREIALRERATLEQVGTSAELRGLTGLPRVLVPAFVQDARGLPALTRVARALLTPESSGASDLRRVAELSAERAD